MDDAFQRDDRPTDPEDGALCTRVLAHARERAFAYDVAKAEGAAPAPDPDPNLLPLIARTSPDLHVLYSREYTRYFDAFQALRAAAPPIGLRPFYRLPLADLLPFIAHVYGISTEELVQRRFKQNGGQTFQAYLVVRAATDLQIGPSFFRQEPAFGVTEAEAQRACLTAVLNDLCRRAFLPPGEFLLERAW